MLCEGLILSKKGFGEGHLSINFLDSQRGKMRVSAYGAALETGKRRAGISSGSFIEGLITLKKSEYYVLSDTKSLLSIDNVRSEFKPMGFAFFVLEILDMMLLEGDIFLYYEDLFESFKLFDQSLDEKYILFFIAKFLGNEGWLHISEYDRLHDTTKRFINYSLQSPMQFLQGKTLSSNIAHELSYFFAYAVKKARFKKLHSLELLRFDKS